MDHMRIGDSVILLAKSLKAALEEKSLPLGLGIGQIQLLMTLGGTRGEGMSRKQLGEKLKIHKGNISRNGTKLLEKNMVQEQLPDQLILTEKGEKTLGDIAPLLSLLNEKMTQGIARPDLDLCNTVLLKMIENLEA